MFILKKIRKPMAGFTLIELMVTIAIVSILAAIAIPNYINYRNKAYCSQAETDGENVAMAISDYFGIAGRSTLPSIDDLKTNTVNPVKISGSANTTITIIVTDKSGRCPYDYRKETSSWDADDSTYTKWIK